jgi:hypothetical protein
VLTRQLLHEVCLEDSKRSTLLNESDRLILQEARFTTLGDLAACTRSKIEELIGERGVNAVGSDLHAHNLDFKPEE